MNANNLKDQGNMFFAARRFNDAVSCYTKAIVSTGLAIVRAQCYSSHLQYLSCYTEDSCRQATVDSRQK